MRMTLKEITLRNDTLTSINNGEIDIDRYIEYIKTNLANANYLIRTKLQSLEPLTLFEALSKVFNIELEMSDLLTILSEKYHRHYTGITTLSTNMVDSDGNNIVLEGASTKKVLTANSRISIKDLRSIVNSYDFLILETRRIRSTERIANPEPFEDYQYERTSLDFNKDDGLFDSKIELLSIELRNNTTLKRILNLVDQFVKELVYQAKSITKLGKEENDEKLKQIGREFGEAYRTNFDNKKVFIEGRHQKSH